MVFRKFERRLVSQFDWQALASMLLLCLIGAGLLYSAGFDPSTGYSYPMNRQIISMGLGLLAFVVCLVIDTAILRRWAYVFYAVGCLMLVAILFTGVVAGGARRWLDLGGFRMQPSEFMKVALILALARLFSSEYFPRNGYSFLQLWTPFVIIAIPVALIVREPDLGTAVCHVLIGGSMLFVAGIKTGSLVRLIIVGFLLLVPSWTMLEVYQQQRILTFLSPEADPQGSGYHALQSKIAVGSGAMTGKGFLEGTQTQLRFLPEQTTDFIFSVLAEEWGFIGSAFTLLLYLFLIYRLFKIAYRVQDRFGSFVCIGVAAMMFWHVLVNIGMVTGVLPVVGLTLPLLSYGGSSLVSVMAALGIVIGCSIKRSLFAS